MGAKFIGIDIGTYNIKIADLTVKKDSVQVGEPTIVRTPRFLVQNGRLADPEELLQLLRGALQQGKHTGRKALVVLNDSLVVTRDLELPDAKPRETEQMVKMDASEYLPGDIGEYAIRYRVLVPGKKSVKKTNYLLMASMKNELALDFHEVIKRAGLIPIAFDTNINCMMKYLCASLRKTGGKLQEGSGTVALLDLGANTVRLVIIHEGMPLLQQIYNHSSQRIDLILANALNIERDEGERLKIKHGLGFLNGGAEDPEASNVGRVIHTQVDLMLGDVYKHISGFPSRSGGVPVARILLTGGMALLKGLDRYIRDSFSVPCEIVQENPNVGFSVEYRMKLSDRSRMRDEFPFFTSLAGAAIRGERT